MDRKYLENDKMIEKTIVNRCSTIYWYRYGEQYKIKVMLYNREIYNKTLDKKHYKIYHEYINERVKYLIDEDILNKDYSMILLDNTMYTVIDRCSHHKELMRILVPVEGEYYNNINDNIFDLVLDSSLRTGEVFDESDLVYHNGVFYNDGNRIKSIRDFEREGVDYELEDLQYGLNNEQLDSLLFPYNKIENYVTKEVVLNIDRWY